MTEQMQTQDAQLDVQREHQKFVTELGDWHRSHSCGQLTINNDGEDVCLMGWVQYRRDHGGLIFVDLRDRDGLTQVVFSPDIAPAAHENAHILRSEYVLAVKGKVHRHRMRRAWDMAFKRAVFCAELEGQFGPQRGARVKVCAQ